MTSERAQFHLLMLEAGERRLLHAELNVAQEEEAPLTELTLALSLCDNDEECMHVLREHLLDHPADMDIVDRMVREELRDRLQQGEFTPECCLQMMRSLSGGGHLGRLPELYQDVCVVEEYRDLAAEGILCDEAYILCLEALLKGEPWPDVWKLNRAIRGAKKKGEPFPGEGHSGGADHSGRCRHRTKTTKENPFYACFYA